MAAPLVIDTNTLWNFAVVGRLDLLRDRFGDRIIWTDTVQMEIQRNVSNEARLQAVLDADWLTAPMSFNSADLPKIARIRAILADPADPPMMHLGEAECMYAVEGLGPEATFVTDDWSAADLARRRRLNVWTTPDIMRDCYAMSEIGCPDAWELLCEMEHQGRVVRAPRHHRDIC